MFPNPWVLLGTFAVWASTLIGCWFYRGHIDTNDAKVKVEAVQLADAKTLRDFKDAAEQRMKIATDTYTKDLQREKTDLADARDTTDRLRHAVEIYANAGSNTQGLPDVAVLRDRLKILGVLFSEMASAGEQSSLEADGVNDALRACEATVGAK